MDVFELIKEKIADQVYMIRDTYGLDNDCTEDYIGAFEEVIDEVAKEYNLMEELLEAKRNCGEDSDCSMCSFGQVQDRCYLSELQISGGNNGWIACSERVPSDCAIHEVTAQFNNGKIYTEFAYYDESREEWWKFDDDGLVNVLAWKEHSEPYKEGCVE